MGLFHILPPTFKERAIRITIAVLLALEVAVVVALIVMQALDVTPSDPGWYVMALRVVHLVSWTAALLLAIGAQRTLGAHVLATHIYYAAMLLDIAAAIWQTVLASSGVTTFVAWLLVALDVAFVITLLLAAQLLERQRRRRRTESSLTLASQQLLERANNPDASIQQPRGFLLRTWAWMLILAIFFFVLTFLGLNIDNDDYVLLAVLYVGELNVWLFTHAAGGTRRVRPPNATISKAGLGLALAWRVLTTIAAIVATTWRIVLTVTDASTGQLRTLRIVLVWVQNTLGILVSLFALAQTIALIVLLVAMKRYRHLILDPLRTKSVESMRVRKTQ